MLHPSEHLATSGWGGHFWVIPGRGITGIWWAEPQGVLCPPQYTEHPPAHTHTHRFSSPKSHQKPCKKLPLPTSPKRRRTLCPVSFHSSDVMNCLPATHLSYPPSLLSPCAPPTGPTPPPQQEPPRRGRGTAPVLHSSIWGARTSHGRPGHLLPQARAESGLNVPGERVSVKTVRSRACEFVTSL